MRLPRRRSGNPGDASGGSGSGSTPNSTGGTGSDLNLSTAPRTRRGQQENLDQTRGSNNQNSSTFEEGSFVDIDNFDQQAMEFAQ